MIATRGFDDKSLCLFGSDRFEVRYTAYLQVHRLPTKHLAAFLHKPYLGTLGTGTTAQL